MLIARAVLRRRPPPPQAPAAAARTQTGPWLQGAAAGARGMVSISPQLGQRLQIDARRQAKPSRLRARGTNMVSSRLTLFLLLALAAASSWLAAAAFVVLPFVSSRVLQRAAASASAARAAAAAGRWRHQRFQQGRIEMRDASMVTDVAVGDRVRVKQGVVLDGRDWGGLEGTVAYVWEKCEVDPHCCCAELGTDGPIRVDFQKVEQSSSDAAGKLGDHESDHNFFNEGELELVVFVARAAGAR